MRRSALIIATAVASTSSLRIPSSVVARMPSAAMQSTLAEMEKVRIGMTASTFFYLSRG